MTEEIFTEEIVKELKKLEQKTGVRYSKIEEEFKKAYDTYPVTLPHGKRLTYTLMQILAMTSNLGDNPLVPYQTFVIGTLDMPKTANVIAYTMMERKDDAGKNTGDPLDLFNPAEGKFGIPTLATFFEKKSETEKLMPFSWWNATLSVTGTGVARREVNSSSYTTFVPINRPEVTPEQIENFKDRVFPLKTLSEIKAIPSRLLPARKEGAPQFGDSLDLRRVVVSIKRTAKNPRRDGGVFCSYTVVDASLGENELMNIKDAEGKIVKYGGVQVTIPVTQYDMNNLAEESIIEIIGTARAVEGVLSMNAVAVTPIVKKEKKAPIAQKPTTPSRVTGQSLSDMANNVGMPKTYI